MTDQTAKVGFIGLGDQGAPIAGRIVASGYDTTLWARRPQSLNPFADTPAHYASSLKELGNQCDIVAVCVYADSDVEQVVSGADGLVNAMKPGSILVIHSTAHPDLCKHLATEAEPMGIQVLDAPVSGGNARAVAANMAVMVGGPKEAYDRALPIFQTFASTIEWVGPVGSGQLCKLINNSLFTLHCAAALVFLKTGEALGLDRGGLSRMLAAGSAQSFALEHMATASIEALQFGETRLRKDIALMEDVLQRSDSSGNDALALAQRGFELYKGFTLREP